MSRRLLLICLALVAAVGSTTLAVDRLGAERLVTAVATPAPGGDTVEDRTTDAVSPTARVERRHDQRADVVDRDDADLTAIVPDAPVVSAATVHAGLASPAATGRAGLGVPVGGRAPPQHSFPTS